MIGRGSLASILNNLVGAVLGLLALNLITAYAGATAWGMWLYALALLAVLSLINGLGFLPAHVRRVSTGHPPGDANSTYLAVKVLQTGLFIVFSLTAYGVATRLLGRSPQDTTPPVLILAMAYYAALSIRQFFDGTFQGLRRFAAYESVLFVDTIATVLGTMTASLTVGYLNGFPIPLPAWGEAGAALLGHAGRVSPELAALWLAAAYLGGKLISLTYAAILFGLHRVPLGRPHWGIFRDYRHYAGPLAIASGMGFLFANLDRLFLGFFWTREIVAEYGLALQLILPVVTLSGAFGALFFPVASHHLTKRDAPGLRRVVGEAERYLSMAITPALALSFVFAPEAVRIVTSGPSFDASIPVLRLLVVYAYFASIGSPVLNVLLGFDKTGVVARAAFLQLTLMATLGLVVIPPSLLGVPLMGAGAPGVAALMSLLAVLTYAYTRRSVRAILALPPVPRGIGRQWAAAAAVGGLLWWMRGLLEPSVLSHAWQLGLVGVLGMALYAGALTAIGGLERRDRAILLDFLHPGHFARYVYADVRGRPPKGPVK